MLKTGFFGLTSLLLYITVPSLQAHDSYGWGGHQSKCYLWQGTVGRGRAPSYTSYVLPPFVGYRVRYHAMMDTKTSLRVRARLGYTDTAMTCSWRIPLSPCIEAYVIQSILIILT